jgi:hypothetical protein
VLDALGHLVERDRQLAELIVRFDVDPVCEVSLSHALGSGEQFVDRSRDRPRQCDAHGKRDQLDDDKE